jgi:tripeptide aminopeptidase
LSVIETFLDLVRIDSPSLKERNIAEYTKSYLENLGFEVKTDNAQTKFGGNSGNVIAFLGSKRPAPCILFNAHLDTVEPGIGVKPVIDNGYIKSDGATVLGGDNKAGVAIVLEAAKIVIENNLDRGPIQIIFTVAEEKGLLGSKNIKREEIRADLAFVLDAEGDAGTLILKAPSQNSIKALFRGRSAHAGVDPEKGVNAIQSASKAISYMKLGRISHDTTANVGIIKGGIAGNIVPSETLIEGEARSHSEARLKTQTEHMVGCLNRGAHEVGAIVDVNVVRAYESFHLSEKDEVVALAIEAIESIGLVPSLGSSGGGSDANTFNHAGITAVNLGVGEESVHSVEERVAIKNLETGVKIILKIVEKAAKRVRKTE